MCTPALKSILQTEIVIVHTITGFPDSIIMYSYCSVNLGILLSNTDPCTSSWFTCSISVRNAYNFTNTHTLQH